MWPREYYSALKALPEAERKTALQAVPEHFRAWVALYLSMPEDEFAEAKEAARISRIKGRDNRRVALEAIPDPERRACIRAHVEAIFRRRRC